MKNAETVLFRLLVTWTTLGLASGLAYRELTRSVGFSGYTQLSLVHTHTLVLGTVVGMILLVMERLFHGTADYGRLVAADPAMFAGASRELVLSNLVDVLTSVVTAPVSIATSNLLAPRSEP